MTDATDPTWGDGPPRAAIELDPAQVAVLYPCLEPQPHAPHRREGIDGATLWAYRCDGQGGIVTAEPEPAELLGILDPRNAELLGTPDPTVASHEDGSTCGLDRGADWTCVHPSHTEHVEPEGDHDPVAGDWRYAAHQAAETQLEELERAEWCPEECELHDPDVTEERCEGPRSQAGPWDGCRTCIIREVLHAATPIIVAAAVREAQPTRAHSSRPVGT